MTETPDSVQALHRLTSVYDSIGPGLRLLTEIDPGFAIAFADYIGASERAASLEPRLRELLLLAHDVSITNLDAAGARNRVLKALREGATARQITTVVELVTMVSMHGLTRGFALMGPPAGQSQQEDGLHGGYWKAFEDAFPGFNRRMRDANPAAYLSYREMGERMWRDGGLEPAWCELIFVVVDLSNTHLFTEGAALHIANALHYGATLQQVLDTIFLTVPSIARSVDVGFNAVHEGLALFRDETRGPPVA